jgi:hypothetical protein
MKKNFTIYGQEVQEVLDDDIEKLLGGHNDNREDI